MGAFLHTCALPAFEPLCAHPVGYHQGSRRDQTLAPLPKSGPRARSIPGDDP